MNSEWIACMLRTFDYLRDKDPKSQGREMEKLKITWSTKIQWEFSNFPPAPDLLIVITLGKRGTLPPSLGVSKDAGTGLLRGGTCSDAGRHVCDWPPMHVSPHLLLWAVLMNKLVLYNIKLPSKHPHMIIYFTQHWTAETLQQPGLTFWFLASLSCTLISLHLLHFQTPYT